MSAAVYRNIGAPFSRDDGSLWETDMVAAPTDNELRRRRYKLRAVLGESPEELGLGAVDVPAPPEVNPEGEWPLKMEPSVYLDLHKDGKHSDLARAILEAEKVQKAQETEVQESPVAEKEEAADGDASDGRDGG